MSSECGLNAAPSTVTFFLKTEPPSASTTSSTARSRRRRLIASISRRKATDSPRPSSSARAENARMSFGRQPPPKPMPAPRNRRPMRASWPMASASWVTSAPVTSAISAIALMNEIFVARNALAATFTSSAVA